MKPLLLTFLCVASAFALTPTPSPTPLIPSPTPSPTPDISAMVARLKAAKATNKPFTIYYQGGQVNVANANYIALNPSGKFTWIYVFSGDDTAASIPVVMITKLVLVNNYPFDGQ
jgi:hypothetical protein